MIRRSYQRGYIDALAKFALAPPTQIDEFIANVDQAKDVEPLSAIIPPQTPAALDGTTPLQLPSAGC